MTRNNRRRFAPAIGALSIAIGSARSVSAAQCTQDLASCYQQAAGVDGFWARAAYALDCDLSFAGCARESGLGF